MLNWVHSRALILYPTVLVKFGGNQFNRVTFNSLTNDSITCADTPSMPDSRSLRMKTELMWDGKPVLCGGIRLTTECHTYENNGWVLVGNMLESRALATGIGFPASHGSNKGFWITGEHLIAGAYLKNAWISINLRGIVTKC